MISIIEFMQKHKKEIVVILSLGLSLKVDVILEVECDFKITITFLLFVTIGYQVVKRITKIKQKHNIK